jgi:hypothetical protein
VHRLAAVLLLAGCAPWSGLNTTLELGLAAEQFIDYQQSSYATQNCLEANPIIGRCGQVTAPAIYFLATTLLHAAIAASLPRGWRELWQVTWIGIEGRTVYRNIDAIAWDRAHGH